MPDLDDGTIRVEMVSTSVQYAFEYLGANIERLVVTAMTERCHRTLMGALKMNLGGAPEGSAGSGKTEMCKDLAKAVAKQVSIEASSFSRGRPTSTHFSASCSTVPTA